jgi:hypothetical protein
MFPPGRLPTSTWGVIDPAGISYHFGPFTLTLGPGDIIPPYLPMGTSPFIIPIDIPEPSPAVFFGCAGVLSWLFSFRVRTGYVGRDC